MTHADASRPLPSSASRNLYRTREAELGSPSKSATSRASETAILLSPKRDAQRELRNILTSIDSGTLADAGKTTVGGWLQTWLAEAKHNVAPKTLQRYGEIVDLHLTPALGHILLGKLQPAQIQDYYTTALESGRRDGSGGLSAQTVIHHDRVLNVALKRARALRMIAFNPVEDVSRPKVQDREIEALEPAEGAILLATAKATRMFPIIFLALATGLRRGEVLGLRWSDVDLDRRVLTVGQSLEQTKEGLRFKSPKTKRSRRRIDLSLSLVEVLQAHRSQQEAERRTLGMDTDASTLLFTRIDGDPIQPDSITKMFARIVSGANIRKISFHGLRHTHATDLLRAGVHPKIASERLGHASVAITMDTYSHAMPGLQEDAAQRIDAALRTALPKS
jgi:integrase